jgi:hypothetical protein
MANAIILSYIQLNVIMLIAIMLFILMVNVFVLMVNASILSVILANAIILSVIMHSETIQSVFKVNAVVLSFNILSATMPSVVVLFMSSVVRDNVVRLIVVAPNGGHPSKLTHRRTQLFFLTASFFIFPSLSFRPYSQS